MKAPCVLLAGLSMLLCNSLPAQQNQQSIQILNANTRYVSLLTTNGTMFYSVSTNDVVQFVGWSLVTSGFGFTQLGNTKINGGELYTGLTSIEVQAPTGSMAYGTFEITSPSTTVVSNYVPADAVVIPASSTGPVQVILETSPDLVNWTAASPGTYSGANGTNRFFRVRAVAN